MGKAHLTDFLGQVIRPGCVIVYPTRQGNRVRQSEAVVIETYSDRSTGRVIPMLIVAPTGRDSGFIGRSTLMRRRVSTEHTVVVGDPAA